MSTIAEQTLASIVSSNHQAVPVLEKYHLDFCCKGKRTLAEACTEKGLPVETIAEELENRMKAEQGKILPFDSMTAEQLISYILIHHHFYVKQSMPTILTHLEKVAMKHGERFPYMTEVLYLFRSIQEEMTMHMHKEEVILFPRIKEIEAVSSIKQKRNFTEGYIAGPIQVMETEHDHAGELLYRIRELTNGYTAPADACTTFKVSLAELKEFEEDLHRHVHLENNLLFPLAEKMLSQQTMLN
ncbi:MAG: iron-sulfur cluster repair di-iron protein [Ferruginibacter sp.]|nr:iron-sulfur cluster repair di-iron protein [Ferruginibacter sp.]MBU9935350.1 iron-sulfur cluster repair di-iron protein [Ferruginibacter sp.]